MAVTVLQVVFAIVPERPKGSQAMGRQVRAAAIEWQSAPAATKCRPSAVAVLQVFHPDSGHSPVPVAALLTTLEVSLQCDQSNRCPRSVVTVWDAARQMTPSPRSRSCPGVGVHLRRLLIQKPCKQLITSVEKLQVVRGSEGIDREGRYPNGQVGVDGPASVRANGADEKFDAASDDAIRGVAVFLPLPPLRGERAGVSGVSARGVKNESPVPAGLDPPHP